MCQIHNKNNFYKGLTFVCFLNEYLNHIINLYYFYLTSTSFSITFVPSSIDLIKNRNISQKNLHYCQNINIIDKYLYISIPILWCFLRNDVEIVMHIKIKLYHRWLLFIGWFLSNYKLLLLQSMINTQRPSLSISAPFCIWMYPSSPLFADKHFSYLTLTPQLQNFCNSVSFLNPSNSLIVDKLNLTHS